MSDQPARAEGIEHELTEREKLDNVVRLAFGGEVHRFQQFCRVVEETVPPGTKVVLRGSAVTGERWPTGRRSTPRAPVRAISI